MNLTQVRARYRRAVTHVDGCFEVANTLTRHIGGYAGMGIGGLELFTPDFLSTIMLDRQEAGLLIATGVLLLGGRRALEQLRPFYEGLKNALP
jgi:hypothetical protein